MLKKKIAHDNHTAFKLAVEINLLQLWRAGVLLTDPYSKPLFSESEPSDRQVENFPPQ